MTKVKHEAPTSSETVSENIRRRRAGKIAAEAEAEESKKQEVSLRKAYDASYADRYRDGNGAAEGNNGIVGSLLRHNGQTGQYLTGDGLEVPHGTECIAHADYAVKGWIKFTEDSPVVRLIGPYFGADWSPPLFKDLPDNDPDSWRVGLSGKKESPWHPTIAFPLEDTKSGAFYTITATSPTGRGGLRRFLAEFQLFRRRNPNALQVVRLEDGTYRSKFGSTVHKPVLVVAGRVEVGNNTPPDMTVAGLIGDRIIDPSDDLPENMK
jgi:hypothetical protein